MHFGVGWTGTEHLALIRNPLRGTPLVRLHSECLTGDALGSLRCDCGSQLQEALRRIAAGDGSALIYLRGQEPIPRPSGSWNDVRAVRKALAGAVEIVDPPETRAALARTDDDPGLQLAGGTASTLRSILFLRIPPLTCMQ